MFSLVFGVLIICCFLCSDDFYDYVCVWGTFQRGQTNCIFQNGYPLWQQEFSCFFSLKWLTTFQDIVIQFSRSQLSFYMRNSGLPKWQVHYNVISLLDHWLRLNLICKEYIVVLVIFLFVARWMMRSSLSIIIRKVKCHDLFSMQFQGLAAYVYLLHVRIIIDLFVNS